MANLLELFHKAAQVVGIGWEPWCEWAAEATLTYVISNGMPAAAIENVLATRDVASSEHKDLFRVWMPLVRDKLEEFARRTREEPDRWTRDEPGRWEVDECTDESAIELSVDEAYRQVFLGLPEEFGRLNESDKALFRTLVFEEKSVDDLSLEYSMSPQEVRRRLNRVYAAIGRGLRGGDRPLWSEGR